MLRLLLMLLILGGLAFFTLQNLTPIPLVILGIQTQALPLSVWMLIAIAAGGLSTVVIAGLFKASNLFATPKRRATGRSRQTAVGSGPTWMPNWSKADPNKTAASTASERSSGSRSRPEQTQRAKSGEDWNSFDNKLEEWEDWDGYEAPTPSANSTASSTAASARTSYQEPAYQEPTYQDSVRTAYQDPRTVIQDVEPESELEEWEDWDGYEDEPRDRDDRSYRDDRNDRDSRSYRDDQDDPDDEEEWSDRPKRTDFEVPQQPKSVSRTGTIYSYRYRDDSSSTSRAQPDSQPESRPPEGNQPGAVYDADYRVITPPYRPDPDQPAAEDWTVAQDSPEDWDDEDDESDRPRR